MKKIFYGLLMALMIAVSGGVASAHAMEYPDTLPEPPFVENANYVVYRAGNTTYLGIFDVDENTNWNDVDFIHTLLPSGIHQFSVNTSGYVTLYVYYLDVNTWSHSGTQYIDNQSMLISSNVVYLYSTVDIVESETGAVVFPPPPAPLFQIVGEVATEATLEEVTGLGKTIMILTVIAVSCLALLISLKVLPKVLHRFQVK